MPIFRVIAKGKFRGTDAVDNVFTFSSDGAVPLASDMASVIEGYWGSSLLSGLSDKWKIESIVVEIPVDVLGTIGWQFQSEASVDIAGTNSGDALPQQMAALVIGITPSRRRGKKFIAGVTESNQNLGVIGGSFETDLATFASAYVDTVDIGGDTMTPGVCKPDGTAFLAFNSWRVNTLLATQRRRKPGVGS